MNSGQNIAFTVVAGSDLTQFVPVTVAGAICAAGVDFYGVQKEKAKSGDFIGAVAFGETKILCGSGGLAIGDKVSCVASGYATKVVSGGYFFGRCVYAAASGGIANVNVFGPSYWNGV